MDDTLLLDVLRRVAEEPTGLTTILGELGNPLIAFDRQRLILFANEAAGRLCGYHPEELLAKSVNVLLPPRFVQNDAPPPAAIADLTTVELPALRRDGTEVMTVWSYASAQTPAGPIFVLALRERSQVLAELETTTYAAVFENSPVPLALARVHDGSVVTMNQAFAKLFELRREDYLGRASAELSIATPEQRAEIARMLVERGSVRDLECDRRTVTGKPLRVALSVTRVRIGGIDHLLSTVQDISMREAHEVALADARARSDYAVRLSGIGFWYCDLPFDELVWDAQVKRHFFLPPDARVTIDTFYERIVPDDRERTRAAIDSCIRDREQYDVVFRTQDSVKGDVKWIRAMGGTSYAKDGTAIRFDGVTVDITAQKRDEEQLASTAAQLEEANRVKDDFLALLGHELRNPLAPITTAVQLLKLRRVEAREINIIERQAERLTRLVDDLLDVSRVTRGKVTLDKQPSELADLVGAAIEAVSPVIEGARHALVLELPAAGLVVDVDRHRMVQVLSNLLTNAAKYTPPGGRIGVRAHRDGTELVVSVEDNGEGISEELLPRVFDMFVQSGQTLARSQGGLGLGLALVKSLVTLHGGRVSAHSTGLGRGSTFAVYLPASTAALASEPKDAVELVIASTAQRVLVVDDNVDGAELLSDALRVLGYQTAIAHDGERALDAVAAFTPDVVLIDIGLPTMDGYEVARRVREMGRHAAFVAITGYGQPGDRKLSREAGFQEHLTKPVDLKKLREVLDALKTDATVP